MGGSLRRGELLGMLAGLTGSPMAYGLLRSRRWPGRAAAVDPLAVPSP